MLGRECSECEIYESRPFANDVMLMVLLPMHIR